MLDPGPQRTHLSRPWHRALSVQRHNPAPKSSFLCICSASAFQTLSVFIASQLPGLRAGGNSREDPTKCRLPGRLTREAWPSGPGGEGPRLRNGAAASLEMQTGSCALRKAEAAAWTLVMNNEHGAWPNSCLSLKTGSRGAGLEGWDGHTSRSPSAASGAWRAAGTVRRCRRDHSGFGFLLRGTLTTHVSETCLLLPPTGPRPSHRPPEAPGL